MDAMTINGVQGNGTAPFYNWAEPGKPINFSNPPNFNSGTFSFPNRIPENEFSNPYVSSFGINPILELDVEPMNPLQSVSDISQHGAVVDTIDGYNIYGAWDGVQKYLVRERELLEEFFGVTFPANIIVPFNGNRRFPFNQTLTAVWGGDTKNKLYEIWFGLSVNTDTGGISVDTESLQNNVNQLLNLFFGGGDEDEQTEQAIEIALNMPFSTYGPGDSYRLFNFLNNCYNYQSFAYGMQERINLFPERESFWDKVWTGIKKFFPLLIIARNAFLALVGLNVMDLAGRIDDLSNNKREEINRTWKGFGGNTGALSGAVNSGKNKTPILGDAGATATLIASCAPILIAIIKLLGGDDETLEDAQDIAGAIGAAANANCQEYLTAMTGFIAEFGLEQIDAESLQQQFNFEFPEIPEECEAAVNQIIQTFSPGSGDSGGSSPGGNDSGGVAPPPPPPPPGGDGLPEPGGGGGNTTILLAALAAALVLSNQ